MSLFEGLSLENWEVLNGESVFLKVEDGKDHQGKLKVVMSNSYTVFLMLESGSMMRVVPLGESENKDEDLENANAYSDVVNGKM